MLISLICPTTHAQEKLILYMFERQKGHFYSTHTPGGKCSFDFIHFFYILSRTFRLSPGGGSFAFPLPPLSCQIEVCLIVEDALTVSVPYGWAASEKKDLTTNGFNKRESI